MDEFYYKNEDFRRFVDLNAEMYGKSPEFMSMTPTAKAYKEYLIKNQKGKINEDTHKDV